MKARTSRPATFGFHMVFAGGTHKWHHRKHVCQPFRGDPLVWMVGVVVVDIHHQTISRSEVVGGAQIMHILCCDVIKTYRHLERGSVRYFVFVRVVLVRGIPAQGRCVDGHCLHEDTS